MKLSTGLVLALALLLAACSDNSTNTGSGTATRGPTKVIFQAGFQAQANLPFV